MKYIHQLDVWPLFRWESKRIEPLLGVIRNAQGRLMGSMESCGLTSRNEAALETLTLEIVKSSEIEGEVLDLDQVRSSLARRLGIDIGGLVIADRFIDGIVEMMLDATQHYDKPLTRERLCDWQACLFPTGRSGMHKIIVGDWRDDHHGSMQVVSGPVGQERVHFEAPAAQRLEQEMNTFFEWFNGTSSEGNTNLDPVLKSAIAHLWFVTLHPFDDGNGRIARAITDMQLARADCSCERFYSMSVQIRRERNDYYAILEKIQKSSQCDESGIDITLWLEWFFGCLGRALEMTEETLKQVLKKARFWHDQPVGSMNNRQTKMINKLFGNFEGKLTSSKWAQITKCSHDTALRDIHDLLAKGVLVKDSAGGRSTSYSLAPEHRL